MTALPLVLQNLIESFCAKNNQLDWEIHGGKDSEVVQITLTWRNINNVVISNNDIDEAAEWTRLKREEFFEGFCPINNTKENQSPGNSSKDRVPIKKPTPVRKSENEAAVQSKIERKNSIRKNETETELKTQIEKDEAKTDDVFSNSDTPSPVKKEPAILTKLRETSQASKTTSNSQTLNESQTKPLGKLRRSETMPSIDMNGDRDSSERGKGKKNPFRRSKKDKLGKGGKLHLALNLECDSQTDDAYSDFEEMYRDYNKKVAPINAPLVHVQEVMSSGTISEEESGSVKKKYKGSLSEEAATIGAKILANKRYSLKRGSLEVGVKDFLEKENVATTSDQNSPTINVNPELETARKISSTNSKEVEIQMLDQLSVYNVNSEDNVKIVVQAADENKPVDESLNTEGNESNQDLSIALKNERNAEEKTGETADQENITKEVKISVETPNIQENHAEILEKNDEVPPDDNKIQENDNTTKDIIDTKIEESEKKDTDTEKENKLKEASLTQDNSSIKKRKRGDWTKCQDCLFSGFCDEQTHKDAYMNLLQEDAEDKDTNDIECGCNVCNGGAVNNGCVYREMVRLRNDYKLFDKRNRCYCPICVPFKYRTMCLRQELRVMRQNGQDEYHRLVGDGPDGRRLKMTPAFSYSDDESSDEDFKFVVQRSRKR